MADNISTIGTGKDHTTDLLWEAATDNDLVTSTTKEIGRIETNEDFTGNLVIAGATTDGTNYRVLTVASANRHSGVEGTGHARKYMTSSGHAVQVSEDYFVIEYLDINLVSGQVSSEECIHIDDGVDPVLIAKCIIHQDSTSTSSDGIYAGDADVRVFVDNCHIYHFQRHGIHAQMFVATARTQTWNIDYCSVNHNNINDLGSVGNVMVFVNDASSIANMNIFNTYALDTQGTTPLSFTSAGSGTVNWAGSDDAADDTTAESKFTSSFDSVSLVDTSPGSGENVWVNEKDNPSEDYSIAGETAFTISQFGLNRIGSEPANSVWTDNPQDFSTDIAGRTRSGVPCISIGPYQFTAPGDSIPQKYMHLYRQRVA